LSRIKLLENVPDKRFAYRIVDNRKISHPVWRIMKKTNRRTFLRLAASLAVLTGRSRSSRLWAAAPTGSSPVKAWRTSEQERFQSIAMPAWQPSSGTSPACIRLDPAQRYQQILGFGAALTDASCYLLEQAGGERRRSLLDDCFGAQGLRLSVARTCIGSSDYSVDAYSFDDTSTPDPDLKHFSIDHDRKYILPCLREARQLNPGLFLFSSPWSPPAWMKAGNSLLGGSMRKSCFDSYAQYFVKFLEGYRAEGIKIDAVTIQNEVDTDQDGRMPQALWGQEYEVDFVKDHLGPALAQASPETRIWIIDHNYNLWGRAVDELSDPAVYKYVDGIAWHGYYGSPEAMTRVHEMFPEKNAYWTEGGPDLTAPDYATDWAKWSSTFAGILRNWARCIVSWNLVLDENGKPNIGPFSCGGLVTLNSKTHEITRSGQYWALAHYSKVIQRGGHVMGSWGDLPGIDHLAVENPDGSRVLVLTNKGTERRVQCTLGSQSLEIGLAANSVTSLLW
jgi:glucosylceramidase